MAFNLSSFKSNMTADGARASLFEVMLVKPSGITTGAVTNFNFKIRGASIPGATIGAIDVPYMGRILKFAGNRTYPDWTTTIINDEDFAVRKYIEKWMAGIASHPGNVRTANAVGPSAYTADLSVKQLGKSGSTTALRTYTFEDAFPTDIAEIPLDWGDTDTIEEFSVTWSYQFWTAS